MIRLLLSALASSLVLLMLSSVAIAQSKWDRPSSSVYRVGLVIGTSGTEAELVDQELSTWTMENDGVVIRSLPVTGGNSERAAGDFAEIRDQGKNLFFFEAPMVARQYLLQHLAGKLEITRTWMIDDGESEALFEAVLFLVRAYVEEGQTETAKQWMNKLVTALPAHQPDERNVPPSIVDNWRTSLQELERAASQIDFTAVHDDPSCEPELNGSFASDAVTYVEPLRTYLVGVRCDDELHSRWVSVAADETYRVEVLDDSLSKTSLAAMFTQWKARRHFDLLVYLGPGECGQESQSLCLAIDEPRSGDGDLEFREFQMELIENLVSSTDRGMTKRR